MRNGKNAPLTWWNPQMWTSLTIAVYRRTPQSVRRALTRLLSPTFAVGALVIVRRTDGHVLLVRQSYRPDWFLPGGLLQRGETPVQAAARELAEEVGLTPSRVDGPVGTFVDAGIRTVTVFCEAVVDQGTAGDAKPASREIVEARWFAPDALPAINEELERALRGTHLLGR
jgi:8-oxo-dGTP pyrophosphatase MutT (NUDIX family)